MYSKWWTQFISFCYRLKLSADLLTYQCIILLRHSWRDLVFIETRPVNQNHYVLKHYIINCGLSWFPFWSVVLSLLWFWLALSNLTSNLSFGVLKVCCEFSLVKMSVFFLGDFCYWYNVLCKPHTLMHIASVCSGMTIFRSN